MGEPEVSEKEEPRSVQSFLAEQLDKRGSQPGVGTAVRTRLAEKAGNPMDMVSLSVKRQPDTHVSSWNGSEWRH